MDVSKNTRPTVSLSVSYREANIIQLALYRLAASSLQPSTVADAERMLDELAAVL